MLAAATAAPGPQPATIPASILIAAHGTGFLLFVVPWMDLPTILHWTGLGALAIVGFGLHFLLLWKRRHVYDWASGLAGNPIRFFEFPFFLAVTALYLVILFILPFSMGLVPLANGLAEIATNQERIMYVLFGGGGLLVTAIISGLDVYPVNVFPTKDALNHLVDITRDLMKASNRAIIIVTGTVVVGWAFKRIDLTPHVVYLTIYAIVGMAIGSTAVLGSRLTELLYLLSAMEKKMEKHPSTIDSRGTA